jgi:hypothetical protein
MNTSYKKIRRNATRQIADLLSSALVICGSRYDDMDGDVYFTKTAEEVMADLGRFDSIYARVNDAGQALEVTFSYHRGSYVSAWLDVEFARHTLNARGFARLFPNDPASVAFRAAEAEKKAAADLAASKARDAAEQELNALPVPGSFEVGDRIAARFASLNKRCNVEEYRDECLKPEREAGRYSTNWSDDSCKVEKVLELSRAEFAALCKGLLEGRADLGEGGTSSDYELPEGVTLMNCPPALRDAWMAESYRLVTVVTCVGCRPLVIDPQGYKYARYVGLWPVMVAPVNPLPTATILAFPGCRTVH